MLVHLALLLPGTEFTLPGKHATHKVLDDSEDTGFYKNCTLVNGFSKFDPDTMVYVDEAVKLRPLYTVSDCNGTLRVERDDDLCALCGLDTYNDTRAARDALTDWLADTDEDAREALARRFGLDNADEFYLAIVTTLMLSCTGYCWPGESTPASARRAWADLTQSPPKEETATAGKRADECRPGDVVHLSPDGPRYQVTSVTFRDGVVKSAAILKKVRRGEKNKVQVEGHSKVYPAD